MISRAVTVTMHPSYLLFRLLSMKKKLRKNTTIDSTLKQPALRSVLPSSYTVERRSAAGIGLYATEYIRSWQKVIEYIGPKVTNKVADTVGWQYLFEVNDRYTILWNVPENKARRINHACKPNCEPREIRGHIFIFAIKNISPGTELTYHYGKDFLTRIIQKKMWWCRCATCVAKSAIVWAGAGK